MNSSDCVEPNLSEVVSSKCWCGNKHLQTFSEDYFFCNECGTLVVAAMPQQDIAVVKNDESKDELYAKNYWFEHSTQDLHQSDIYIRSRTDLTDRCTYWLQTLLRYKLPPAKVIDVGCGHGAFTAFMQSVGYDVIGLEISPWVVEFAKQNFGINTAVGAIEAQNFEKQSIDIIVLMDVVEHLQDPVGTLKHCASLLKPDGLIIIQMPNFPREKSLATLKENNDPFLSHMIKDEHLFLFSKEAIAKLLQEKLGFKHLKFEPAVFDYYDMFLIASQQEFMAQSKERVEQFLLSKPNLRLALTTLDLYEQNQKLQQLYNQADKDRRERLEQLYLLDSKIIAVDLTPVLPNGENGGAKILAIELIKRLAQVADRWKFVILTSKKNHAYLSFLESRNISLYCIDNTSTVGSKRFNSRLLRFMRIRLWKLYHKINNKLLKLDKSNRIKFDLLFCPFTSVHYARPGIPTISVILDLQHRYYPQFFNTEERYHRDHYFFETCNKADYIVTISDYVKKTVLEQAPNDIAGKIETIHIGLASRLHDYGTSKQEFLLNKFLLTANEYLLYPANYWRHKNHEMLFSAFSIYLKKFSDSNLKLVCTGAPSKRMDYLQALVNKMGLSNKIIFAGFLNNEEFAAILVGCKAVIYPSLYEGFGMPVLEAMTNNKPVLCSNHTSLPEIAGEAAIYFDPKKPAEIVAAIQKLEGEPLLIEELIVKGKQRSYKFMIAKMVSEYLNIFHRMLYQEIKIKNNLLGYYTDGWIADSASIVFVKTNHIRVLELRLSLPEYAPYKKQEIKLLNNEKEVIRSYVLTKGTDLIIQREIHNEEIIHLIVTPSFNPKQLGINDDDRDLSCKLLLCKLNYGDYDLDLLDQYRQGVG